MSRAVHIILVLHGIERNENQNIWIIGWLNLGWLHEVIFVINFMKFLKLKTGVIQISCATGFILQFKCDWIELFNQYLSIFWTRQSGKKIRSFFKLFENIVVTVVFNLISVFSPCLTVSSNIVIMDYCLLYSVVCFSPAHSLHSLCLIKLFFLL